MDRYHYIEYKECILNSHFVMCNNNYEYNRIRIHSNCIKLIFGMVHPLTFECLKMQFGFVSWSNVSTLGIFFSDSLNTQKNAPYKHQSLHIK